MSDRRANRTLLRALASACAISAVTAIAPAAFGAQEAKVPAKDSFKGRITAAGGSFKGAHGRVHIVLTPISSGGGTSRFRFTLTGAPCGAASHCLKLDGTLSVKLKPRPSVPDAGARFKILRQGNVKPLGFVAATGDVRGTGLVRHGRETMKMTLAIPDGSITITAQSGRVPGFTSP